MLNEEQRGLQVDISEADICSSIPVDVMIIHASSSNKNISGETNTPLNNEH